jgi:transcriptional regulator with XRE-family HTH domain
MLTTTPRVRPDAPRKVNEAIVREIRRLRLAGNSQARIAADVNITQQHVSNILRGRSLPPSMRMPRATTT